MPWLIGAQTVETDLVYGIFAKQVNGADAFVKQVMKCRIKHIQPTCQRPESGQDETSAITDKAAPAHGMATIADARAWMEVTADFSGHGTGTRYVPQMQTADTHSVMHLATQISRPARIMVAGNPYPVDLQLHVENHGPAGFRQAFCAPWIMEIITKRNHGARPEQMHKGIKALKSRRTVTGRPERATRGMV